MSERIEWSNEECDYARNHLIKKISNWACLKKQARVDVTQEIKFLKGRATFDRLYNWCRENLTEDALVRLESSIRKHRSLKQQ